MGSYGSHLDIFNGFHQNIFKTASCTLFTKISKLDGHTKIDPGIDSEPNDVLKDYFCMWQTSSQTHNALSMPDGVKAIF